MKIDTPTNICVYLYVYNIRTRLSNSILAFDHVQFPHKYTNTHVKFISYKDGEKRK